jgi:Uma2 family endonuclease
MERMGFPELTPKEHFSYRQYKTWPDEERWELIDGHAWCMSPAPLSIHQTISGRLFHWICSFLEGKPYSAYYAPFDILLPKGDEAEDEIDTVVQPDIVVYCDRSRITVKGARGAPDLAVEILSPSTSKKDQREKFDLYQRHGVREYWIVDPAGRWLCVYRLGPEGRFDDGELREPPREYGLVASRVLEGFAVDPGRLFEDLD